jgi:2'-5' RNA ligase
MPRLFIAVPIDESVRSNLARVGTAAEARGVRWVLPDNLHLTLAFLGEVEERRLPLLEDAVYAATEAESTALHLGAQGIGAFPSEAAVKVLWAGVVGEVARLIALRQRLVVTLKREGFDVDPQRYHPHITLARFRWPQPLPARLARLQEYGEWQAGEIHIVESRLHPAGSRYVVRADVPLVDEPD